MRPSASAAVKASRPSWRPWNDHLFRRGHRLGRHGRWHRRAPGQCRPAGAAARHRSRGRGRPQRRSRRCHQDPAQGRPGTLHDQARGASGNARAIWKTTSRSWPRSIGSSRSWSKTSASNANSTARSTPCAGRAAWSVPTPRPCRSPSSSRARARASPKTFMITHFFNPPRYMRLLEIVAGPGTRPEALDQLSDFADRRLGKGVVVCNDTPGFVANRIGSFWMQAAVNAAQDLGLSVEETDAVMSRPFGIPKTGVFGLAGSGWPRSHAQGRCQLGRQSARG